VSLTVKTIEDRCIAVIEPLTPPSPPPVERITVREVLSKFETIS